jgi:transposase InsO family protein
VQFLGLPDKTTESVIKAIKKYQACNLSADTYGYTDIKRIRSDAGTQFTSEEFATYCTNNGIRLSLAAPKKQYQNHLAERTWQTISSMARTLLVHARLPDTFWFHAIVYVTYIFTYYLLEE